MRLTARTTSLALVVALSLAACGGEDVSPDDGTPPAVSADDWQQTELTCVTAGYPCSWADAEPGAFERTQAILTIAAALLSEGESIESIAESIEKAPDVVAVSHDGLGLMFRVQGGAVATVDADLDSPGELLSGGSQATPNAQALAALPALAPTGAFTGCPRDKVPSAGQGASDGKGGVTLDPGRGRHALLLSPWEFELPWNIGPLRDNLELPGSKYRREYGGSVTSKATSSAGASVLQPSQANVVPADFCGWEQFDTIVLMTHGRALCEGFDAKGDPFNCVTTFHVGQYSESAAELKELVGHADGVIISINRYGADRTDLTPEQKKTCHDELELVVLPDTPGSNCSKQLPVPKYTVKVTSDFFRTNYPLGLKDRLIFLAACQGMKFGEMGPILGISHGNGQILGFNKIAALEHAQRLLEIFTERLGVGERIGKTYKAIANDYLDQMDANPDLYTWVLSEVPGGEIGDLLDADTDGTWGSDVVGIYRAGEEITDEGVVGLAQPAPSDAADALVMTLRISDVEDDENPDDYNVTVLWNDQPIAIDDVSWVRGERTSYTANVTVPLPRKLEEDEKFDLEIRGELPAAGGTPTWWKYKDVTAEPADACDQLTSVDVSAAMGVAMDALDTNGLGDFFGAYCSWSTPTEDSQISVLVYSGAADGFRADSANDPLAVTGLGDVATFDPSTGRGDACSTIEDFDTGKIQWVCFLNLTVAFGDDTLYFTVAGNVVGENGPEGVLDRLRDLMAALRE